jgi:pimeloyl-ACP methyl ester carboxylesterase
MSTTATSTRTSNCAVTVGKLLSMRRSAANPDGIRLWVELERKSQVGDGSRQPLANRITEARLGDLKVPTLVISGDADLSTPPSIARMIAARIANSELVVVSESGHSVYWEQPEAFNRAVLDFIARHRG